MRAMSAFQKRDVQVLSRSLMIESGAPKVLSHALKSCKAVFSAVSDWLAGISRVKPESQQVHVKSMSYELILGSGPMKSMANWIAVLREREGSSSDWRVLLCVPWSFDRLRRTGQKPQRPYPYKAKRSRVED